MSWFNVWDGLKNKTCRYLLQRYLGQFLEEKLNLEQLKIELYSGKATVKNVSLNIDALNELCEAQGWAVQVVSGHIGEINVTVPWNALMTKDSSIEVFDLDISVRPIKRVNTGSSMLESIWSSASSSIQMAEECMKQKEDELDDSETIPNAIIGLEKFAETIDNVLNRIDAKFTNTNLRLECVNSRGNVVISLVTTIKEINYKNETGYDKKQDYLNKPPNAPEGTGPTTEQAHVLPSFANHKVKVNGIRFYTHEVNKNINETYNPHLSARDSDNCIPIIEICGEQKIEIKMKQSEEVSGPKIGLSIQIGAIYSFFTPRQIHLLSSIITAFNMDNSNIDGNLHETKKSETRREDLHLFGENVPNMTGILGDSKAWQKKCEDKYSHANPTERRPTQCESMTSSLSSSTTFTSTNKYQSTFANRESCVDIVNFSVKIDSFVGVLLHGDVSIDKANLHIMQLTNNFFVEMENFGDNYLNTSLLDGRKHLYIRLKPVVINGIQERNKNTLLLKCLMTAAELKIYEALQAGVTPLIRFDAGEDSKQNIKKNPDISVQFSSSTSCKINEISNTTLSVNMEKCTVEMDISIYDRLSAYLCESSFDTHTDTSQLAVHKHHDGGVDNLCINVSCAALNIKLRFPIVSMGPDRLPWWEQYIRREFLLISLKNLTALCKSNHIEVNSAEINAYFCEDETAKNIKILTSQHNMNTSGDTNNPCFPKITISKAKNLDGIAQRNKMKHPFSARQECRQSDTIHSVHESEGDFEPLLLPGEREEINRFCKEARMASDISVCIHLPCAIAFLESKHLYEILYNRINADLLMWEPTSCLFSKSESATNTNKENAFNCLIGESIVKSKVDICSASQASKSLYYSTQETTDKYTRKVEFAQPSNRFTLELYVGEGSLTLFVPVRDASSQVLPGQSGQFDFHISRLYMSSVNGFEGNDDLGYICLQFENIGVYHCGLVPVNVENLSKSNVHEVDEYMQATFYATPKLLSKSKGKGISEREMMSVVIEVKKNQKQMIKKLKVAIGLQNTTLRHYPAHFSNSWLNQLIDFFDVVDFPIDGYLPYEVITELQLKLWDCAIDYRPRLLDYRAIVEIGSFTMSCNIISSVSGCNLKFALEDCVLSIAPFDSSEIHPESKATCLSSDNLIPVMELGLLDISLRLTETSSTKNPRLDLRFSIHDFHLRTCFDSCCALSELIGYIAGEGDLVNDEIADSSKTLTTAAKSEATNSSEYNSLENDYGKQHQEKINALMAEAVKEIAVSQKLDTNDSLHNYRDGFEVFYFPDESNPQKQDIADDAFNQNEYCDILNFESNVMLNSYYSQLARDDTLPQVIEDLGEITATFEIDRNNENEDGYCMIPDNESAHIGIKNIEINEDPLRIVDNHFCLPNANQDLLKSPDNFPMPTLRYTLCEMTFTWHLYGGHDFPQNMKTVNKMPNPYSEGCKMSEAYKHGVSYSHASKDIKTAKKTKEKLTWKTIGGPNRNQEVLVEIQFTKIRFSHEEYPKQTSYASRQVVLVNDIEVRDRLQMSDIKKFLYHPKKKTGSKENRRDVMVVKALHVRPNPKLKEQECSLRVSILPLRLNIDQNTLIFLSDFFGNINDNTNSHPDTHKASNDKNQFSEPQLVISEMSDDVQNPLAEKLVSTNLDLLMNDEGGKAGKEETEENEGINHTQDQAAPIYFREVVFSPELPICFDYQGHTIEFSRGPIVGLLMGLGQLECSEIRLKKITYRRGLLGIDKMIKYLCKEWLKDIKKNQMSKILKGVGPTKAFKQLFDGIYDLFRLPFEQYQKDGRLIRGIQLGAQSFTARTALAALEITARIIQLLQFTAETAFDMVSPGPSLRQKRRTIKGKKRRTNRPKDIREGVTNAYLIVKEGINDSANNLIETAVSEHDQKGYAGAVGAVMRQIPQLVVCPAVLATQATNNILGGVKSSLVPDAKVEAREKWKDESD